MKVEGFLGGKMYDGSRWGVHPSSEDDPWDHQIGTLDTTSFISGLMRDEVLEEFHYSACLGESYNLMADLILSNSQQEEKRLRCLIGDSAGVKKVEMDGRIFDVTKAEEFAELRKDLSLFLLYDGFLDSYNRERLICFFLQQAILKV